MVTKQEQYTMVSWQGVYQGAAISGTCPPIPIDSLPNDCTKALKLTRDASKATIDDARKAERDAFNSSSVARTHIQSHMSRQYPGLLIADKGMSCMTVTAETGKGLVMVRFSPASTFQRQIFATTVTQTVDAGFTEGEVMGEVVRYYSELKQVVPYTRLAELMPAARVRLEQRAYADSTRRADVLRNRIKAHQHIVDKHQTAIEADRRALALHVARTCKYAPAGATPELDAIVTDSVVAHLTAGLPLGTAPMVGTEAVIVAK